jgi:uncharacterized phage-associated protein
VSNLSQSTPRSCPASAASVANAFLELGWAEQRQFPPIDQMKLQKLLFYAHAWFLGNSGQPLFEEDFEAWPWGPVVRNVYFETRKYGRSPISSKVTELAKVGPGAVDFQIVVPELEEPSIKEWIKNVWEVYAPYDGIQLSNSTHAEGEPWTIIKERLGTDLKPSIPNSLIRAVYQKKVEDAAHAVHTPAN